MRGSRVGLLLGALLLASCGEVSRGGDAALPDMRVDQKMADSTALDGPVAEGTIPDGPLPDGKVDQSQPDGHVPDLLAMDQAGNDQTVPDHALPDKSVPDLALPDQYVTDLQAWPDGCAAQCSGKVCGDADGCGGTCAPGSGCYTPPGKWKTLKAGSFQMGSPLSESCRSSYETQHQVTLTHKFEIQATEVTQGQFTSVMGYSPSKFSSCGSFCPVEQVNWHEAAAYANAMSNKAGLTPCYTCMGSGKSVTCAEATTYAGTKVYGCPGYRLPTEAEWEFAYRAGTSTALYNGGITSCTSTDPNLEKIGWYRENSGNKTHLVSQKTPNAWGLYDMAGNVWEWCHDWYNSSYGSSAVTDPVGTAGTLRVLRGGSWFHAAGNCRAAYRSSASPGYRYRTLGLRLARSVP